MKAKKSEKSIQDQTIAYLVFNRFLVWRNNQGSMISEYKGKTRKVRFSTMDGISDLQAVKDGRAIFIEMKKNQKEIDKAPMHQQVFIASVQRYGGVGFFACSLEQVYENLVKAGFSGLQPPEFYNQHASKSDQLTSN